MNRLGFDEEELLLELCDKYKVNPDHLRILIYLKKEYSYKSASKKNELRNEIEKHIELWSRPKAGDNK
ncbi:DNA modification system-associated small protein [Paenibacillus roseipurpureus]|uniref:Uncharacterized protein n=1 Tax=Paenibacillus roseopurpureus TaxID=2918901 RepID=A0AA96RKW1_9BACL|nr:DNA modification system-associated small protein [Paenibacillus sp. MBLB1832]WNR45125.1 hypothetical protein MJB10_02950 [Paenibacillus sp. MBLB1832]